MTLQAEILERSEAVCKELRRGGVKAEPYKRPVEGTPTAVCVINTHRDIVKVWAGLADINVAPSKNKKVKQAVMNIKEGDREIAKIVNILQRDMVDEKRYAASANRKSVTPEAIIARMARGLFPIAMPRGTTFTAKILEKDFMAKNFNNHMVKHWRVELTAKAPTTELSLLVGKDEMAQFISALPTSPIASVEAAHTALRPAGVPADALRQGEWFFVPVTKTQQADINSSLRQRGNIAGMPGTSRLEAGSNHWCSAILRISPGVNVYATGMVIDNRGTRHEPLMLPGWYRVVRNTEQTVPASMNSRSQQRGWD